MAEITKKYMEFVEQLQEKPTRETMDYLGINFQEGKEEAVFKVYYATRVTPSFREHPLVAFLYGRDMLRDFELVKDTISADYVRLDTAIKQRNDENMEALFSYLDEKTELFAKCKEEVQLLARMKITPLEAHEFASIYHLGITEKEGKIDTLKWYFFTRWCSNPDKPGKDSEYRDAYYLDYLRKTGILQYQILAEKMEALQAACGGNLWMAAMDVRKDGWRKYKIYVQHLRLDYDFLEKWLDGTFGNQVQELKDWNEKYPELECDGMALCLDNGGISSVNFYFGYR